MILVDANIILRYLLNDHPQLSIKAADIIESQEVNAPIEVICEVVYVLLKVYQIPKQEISNQILLILEKNIIATDKPDVVKYAPKYFYENNLDIVDALLLAYAVVENQTIFTFDNKLNKYLKSNKNIS